MNITLKLKEFIEADKPFALLRLPGEKEVFLLEEDTEGENFYIFNSFDGTKKYQFSFKEFTKTQINDWEKETVNTFLLLGTLKGEKIISKQEYIELLIKTIQFLQQKKAHKIVISREKWIENGNINPLKSFVTLCNKYPLSFCHLSFWNKEEVWLGATPEVLGTFDGNEFKTMSLAGTLPDNESFQWKDKEKEEQQIVTFYIEDILNKYSKNIKLEGPKTLHLGHIKHLVTYFLSKLNKAEDISELIEELHPTPAVCGLPLEVSKEFIKSEEGYDRDFYAGFIGLVTEQFQKYFVNLRSGKLYRDGALLFVGGGITAQSNPEKEWEETELKSRFIGECL